MAIISDLHIHSRFSRACSNQITIKNLEKYARIKGVNLLGTGDFTHKKWYDEIIKETKEDENGILRTDTGFPFIWQTEISLMYTQGGKGRRIHFVILAPNKGAVDQITEALGKKGRLDYDGRPIFGFSAIELVEMMQKISDKIEIIPAHIWTSFFGILGSKSGFNSFEECFQDKVKYIHALETGMSSNPSMNWRVSSLDKFAIVSFSDSHSFWPWRLGREATIFDCDLIYENIINCIRNKKGISTIEVNPAYGKYHFDGHRLCNVCFNPIESKQNNNICPKCHKELTIGVLNRVEQLADRPENYIPKNAPSFKSVVPLHELIGASYSTKLLASKTVWDVYNKLMIIFKNEFNILLDAKKSDLEKVVPEQLAELIMLNRENKLKINPGYDGTYGELIDIDKVKTKTPRPQKSLSEF